MRESERERSLKHYFVRFNYIFIKVLMLRGHNVLV